MTLLALYWSIMIACYLLASRLRKYAEKFKFVDKLMSLSVYALVLLMGLRMGADEEVTSSLGSIGIQALFVTVLTAAGSMLGASQFTIFRRIIFPELRPALLTGFGLAFARGLGEYGSVIYISGNSAKHHTQVVSYVIMQKLNYVDYASATAIALAMLVIAFVTLFSINMIQVHQARRVQ